MFSNRHHIHLICDFSDVALHLLQDQLRVYFEQKAYLTHDLFLMRPESSAYSWQCINACDCTLLLIGERYGQLANTGVSQLHISYLNARTKNKPMVAFIKTIEELADNRQLSDFINLIKAQVSDIIEYSDNDDLPTLIEQASIKLEKLLAPKTNLIDEHLPIYDITNDEPVLISTSELMDDNLGIPKTTANKAVAINNNRDDVVLKVVSPNLNDIFSVHCNAHAFQGGTLIDTSFAVQSSWRAILVDLTKISPFSTQGLWKLMNEIATTQAMPAVTATYPEVHAISRCQVVRADILWIQETLLFAGWIERVSQDKEIWQLTDTARNLVQS